MDRTTIGTSSLPPLGSFRVSSITPLQSTETRPIPGARMRYDVAVVRGGESSLYMSYGCWDSGQYFQSALTLLVVGTHTDNYGQTTEFASQHAASSGQFDSLIPVKTDEREQAIVQQAIQESRIGAPSMPPADEPLASVRGVTNNPGQPPRLSHF